MCGQSTAFDKVNQKIIYQRYEATVEAHLHYTKQRFVFNSEGI